MRYLTCLALFFATAVLSSATDLDQLKDVNMVFVAPIEGQNGSVAQMLQAKIISSLTKVQGITVVENEDNADAILMLSGLLQLGKTAHVVVQGGVRLVLKEGGIVLRADNISSNRFARSASTSFADNVAKRLRKLFVADRQQRNSASDKTIAFVFN